MARWPLFLTLSLFAGAASAAEEPADLVVTGGRVVTVDPQRPEAEAVAVRGDRILAVGSKGEILRYTGPKTEVIDARGRLVLPGFIEGHGHFLSLGESKLQLDLREARSWEAIVAQVAEAVKKAAPGEWIRGRGWHQEKWDHPPQPNHEGFPLHASLDSVSPLNPVILTHVSGHGSFVNAKALELAGIHKGTKDPDGGEIVRDASGEPTGFLRERAEGLVKPSSSQTFEQYRAHVEKVANMAGQEALSKGVTSFQDAGSGFTTIDRFKSLAARGELPVRLYVMVRGESNEVLAQHLHHYKVIGYGGGFLTVRAIKRMMDGALGSRGAWLLQPYSDSPSSVGLALDAPDDLRKTAEVAILNGCQLNVHAIGDRANREVLDIFEEAFRAHPEQKDLRFRIEHAQHLSPADIPRFAKLGVIASMQAIHATSDGPWVEKRLGAERTRTGAFVWRSLLDSGAIVTNGTDVPVEDIDPILNFYAAVSRRMEDGTVFHPEQRMTRDEALRATTIQNAFAAFEEGEKGSLTPGKLADLVVLSGDILRLPEEEIPRVRVDFTILGGKVRYRRPSS